MRQALYLLVAVLGQTASAGAQTAPSFTQWLCTFLAADIPELALEAFPDERSEDSALDRRRPAPSDHEVWELSTEHYRLRLDYRIPEDSPVRLDFHLMVELTDPEHPFFFRTSDEAVRFLARLGPTSDPSGRAFTHTRPESNRAHFYVVADASNHRFEMFWEEKWLVTHPLPQYRELFGPDFRARLCLPSSVC